MTPHCKKYGLHAIVGFIAYGLGLFALNYFYTPHSPYKYWLILLPVLPIIYLTIALVLNVSTLDEMWRKVVTEAMAFSGIATGFTCFTYLFLRDMGAPEFHAEWAFYIMWVYYGIGLFFSYWRYK